MSDSPEHDPLPYQDKKPQGHADFYMALNATFRFLERTQGRATLEQFWADHGEDYMAPVWKRWKEGGLGAIADYWRAFFKREPSAEVDVEARRECVEITVSTCPAISHLRKAQRDIFPEYCQHCYFVSEAAARKSGHTVRVSGGNGSCVQRFYAADAALEKQKLSDIELAR